MRYKFLVWSAGLMLALLFFSACRAGYQLREQQTQEWIDSAKRPIKVTRHATYQHFKATRGSHYYTLVDSSGQVFLARNVRFELPEVIE